MVGQVVRRPAGLRLVDEQHATRAQPLRAGGAAGRGAGGDDVRGGGAGNYVPPADDKDGLKYLAFERQEQVLLLGAPTPNSWIECDIQHLNRRGWVPFDFFRLL